MRFEVRHNGDVVVHQVERVAHLLREPSELLDDLGEHMVNTSIPETFRAGGRPTAWPRSAWQAESAQQESGALLRSITHELAGGSTLRVGSNLRYARQRHLGGELEPTKSKALAIPLPGMPKSMRRPRRWGDRLFFMESEKGKAETVGILATKDGRTGAVTPRFILRRKVTQPARPFLVFLAEDITWLNGRLAQHLQEAVRG